MKKFYLLTFLLSLLCTCLLAQWDGNPATVNNPISTAATDDYSVFNLSDGTGGIITVWWSYSPGGQIIQAQHKTKNGMLVWGTADQPLNIVDTARDIFDIHVKADGAAGVYICWEEFNYNGGHSYTYLQHLDSNGTKHFGDRGMMLNISPDFEASGAQICADIDGVVVMWEDYFYGEGFSSQFVAQRYSKQGISQWGSGSQVSIAGGVKNVAKLISDGNHGALVVFSDSRNSSFENGSATSYDLYAQHINNTGVRLWGDEDAAVSTGGHISKFFDPGELQLISDNSGGFICVFPDSKNSFTNSYNNEYYHIAAQRLNMNGTKLWAEEGVILNETVYASSYFSAASDGGNGVVVNFQPDISKRRIYLQRIDGDGSPKWGPDGRDITNTDTYFDKSDMAADSEGNNVVCWAQGDSLSIIKAQKFNKDGIELWKAGGVDICTNSIAWPEQASIVISNEGSTIIAWQEIRNTSSGLWDIYSAKVGSNGILINTASVTYYSTSNGNWNNPATWAGNTVPPAGAVVVVTTAVTVNTNIICTTLTVQAPGSLKVLSGFTVTVLQ